MKHTSKNYRQELYLLMVNRPLRLLSISIQISADKPTGYYLKHAKKIDELTEESKEEDEAIAKTYGLW